MREKIVKGLIWAHIFGASFLTLVSIHRGAYWALLPVLFLIAFTVFLIRSILPAAKEHDWIVRELDRRHAEWHSQTSRG